MPRPVRKEKLPDDFSNIDVTILSRMSHPASCFPAVFTSRMDRSSAIHKIIYTTRAKQEISTFPVTEVEIVAYWPLPDERNNRGPVRHYQTYVNKIMNLSFNRQRNPDSVVAFKTLNSLFNVLQDFNTL